MLGIKKIAPLLTAAVFAGIFGQAGSLHASAAFTPDATIYSEGVYMVNLDTDIPVVAKNENKAFSPASTAKIMTALVVLENVSDLSATVKVTWDATNEFYGDDPNLWNVSSAAIDPLQDNLSYLDCLYGMLLPSGCEAANILAYNVGGGEIQAFVNLMNQMAQKIGAVNSHFSNPHGLYAEDNYTTAYDLYLITRYAYDNYPQLLEITNTYQYEMPANTNNPNGYTITNTNALIKSSSEFYYEYATGVKTGSIDYYYNSTTGQNLGEGWKCLVSTATKDGFTYMIVTLGAPYYDSAGTQQYYSFEDHIALYKWAFSTFTYQAVILKDTMLTQLNINFGSSADTVQLLPSEDYYTLLPADLDEMAIQKVIYLYLEDESGQVQRVEESTVTSSRRSIDAPVTKGEQLGDVELYLYGELIDTIPLLSARAVSRSEMDYAVYRLQLATQQSWFMPLVFAIVVLFVALIVVLAIRRNMTAQAAQKNNRPKPRGRNIRR